MSKACEPRLSADSRRRFSGTQTSKSHILPGPRRTRTRSCPEGGRRRLSPTLRTLTG